MLALGCGSQSRVFCVGRARDVVEPLIPIPLFLCAVREQGKGIAVILSEAPREPVFLPGSMAPNEESPSATVGSVERVPFAPNHRNRRGLRAHRADSSVGARALVHQERGRAGAFLRMTPYREHLASIESNAPQLHIEFRKRVWTSWERAIDFLREAPPCNLRVRKALAPTEGSRQQNRGAGFHARQPAPHVGQIRSFGSRASECVGSDAVWRSLRKSASRVESQQVS